MAVFDVTGSSGSFLDKIRWLNNLTAPPGSETGILFTLLLIVTCGGLMLAMKKLRKEESFFVAMLVGSVMAVPLILLHLITPEVLFVTLIIFVISIYFLFKARGHTGF